MDFILMMKEIFVNTRACLKDHSSNMHVPLREIFRMDFV